MHIVRLLSADEHYFLMNALRATDQSPEIVQEPQNRALKNRHRYGIDRKDRTECMSDARNKEMKAACLMTVIG